MKHYAQPAQWTVAKFQTRDGKRVIALTRQSPGTKAPTRARQLLAALQKPAGHRLQVQFAKEALSAFQPELQLPSRRWGQKSSGPTTFATGPAMCGIDQVQDRPGGQLFFWRASRHRGLRRVRPTRRAARSRFLEKQPTVTAPLAFSPPLPMIFVSPLPGRWILWPAR